MGDDFQSDRNVFVINNMWFCYIRYLPMVRWSCHGASCCYILDFCVEIRVQRIFIVITHKYIFMI